MWWGKILAVLICSGLIIGGGIMLDIEKKKTTPNCDNKVIGTALVTSGSVALFFAVILMIYNHMLDTRNNSLKYCNTGFDVLRYNGGGGESMGH